MALTDYSMTYRSDGAPDTTPRTEACACVHASHFPERRTPGHPYQAIRPRVTIVRTPCSRIPLCQRCHGDGHMQA